MSKQILAADAPTKRQKNLVDSLHLHSANLAKAKSSVQDGSKSRGLLLSLARRVYVAEAELASYKRGLPT